MKYGPCTRDNIAAAIERLNQRLQISDDKLSGFMGRKTLATLGRNFFNINAPIVQDVGNWKDPAIFQGYVDSNYEDLERGSLVSRTFQELEQGRYEHVVIESLPRHLALLRRRVCAVETRLQRTERLTEFVCKVVMALFRLSAASMFK